MRPALPPHVLSPIKRQALLFGHAVLAMVFPHPLGMLPGIFRHYGQKSRSQLVKVNAVGIDHCKTRRDTSLVTERQTEHLADLALGLAFERLPIDRIDIFPEKFAVGELVAIGACARVLRPIDGQFAFFIPEPGINA